MCIQTYTFAQTLYTYKQTNTIQTYTIARINFVSVWPFRRAALQGVKRKLK